MREFTEFYKFTVPFFKDLAIVGVKCSLFKYIVGSNDYGSIILDLFEPRDIRIYLSSLALITSVYFGLKTDLAVLQNYY